MKTIESLKNGRFTKYLFPLFILYAFFHILMYGSLTSFCAESETLLPVEEKFLNATIIFEHTMTAAEQAAALLKGSLFQSTHCTPVSDIPHILMSENTNSPNHLETNENYVFVHVVPYEKKFFIIKRVYVNCRWFACMGGAGGDVFILKDEEGLLYKMSTVHWKNLDRDHVEKPWNAGYYDGNKRLGAVDIRS